MNMATREELVKRIEAVEAERDRARALLQKEHEARIGEVYGIHFSKHQELQPNCQVCQFLESTSLVKM